MRLVIDLQGAQSGDSRDRGIGRYSLALAEAMSRHCGEHEVWLALNDAFADTIEPIRAAFDGLVPQRRIVLWNALRAVSKADPADACRRKSGAILYEAFLAGLRPDRVLVSSLFEGFGGEALTSVGSFIDGGRCAVTLYDLIPLVHRQTYLQDPQFRRWYLGKLGDLRRAGQWLAISEATRQDAFNLLGLPADGVANISAAASPFFRRYSLSDASAAELRARYRLDRPFVLYTGGFERRKNMEGAVEAFAKLPIEVRDAHQLALVCAASPGDIKRLESLARKCGLSLGSVVTTGFVSDDDLRALYNICSVFCFPSLYEGFGLPVLEAMQCGAAVIGSNTSSIPEVIGRADALFNPRDSDDIARVLNLALTDSGFRSQLARHGLEQAKQFTWSACARRAWQALGPSTAEETAPPRRSHAPALEQKPRLAFVSPLPPERSGISDYAAELLPELSRYYDIDVIVDQESVDDPWIQTNCQIRRWEWFDKNAYVYDRVCYQFGNSHYHMYMLDLLSKHPGVVDLHDFYLSGLFFELEARRKPEGFLLQALYRAHGYGAVLADFRGGERAATMWKYPINSAVVESAIGLIVHSEYTSRLLDDARAPQAERKWTVVPHPARMLAANERVSARMRLGVELESFVVAAFGNLGETKKNDRLLQAWRQSKLADDKRCHLIFVGGLPSKTYRAKLLGGKAADRVAFTDFTSLERYGDYLAAADVAVQLRELSRGESSYALIDALAAGLPTVVNAHGSFAELPRDRVVMLDDDFETEELTRAIERLYANPSLRAGLSDGARQFVEERHAPRVVAASYFDAIEHAYATSAAALRERTIRRLAQVPAEPRDEGYWVSLAAALERSLPGVNAQKTVFVAASSLARGGDDKSGIPRVVKSIVKCLASEEAKAIRIEPVYFSHERNQYCYARRFTAELIGVDIGDVEDEPISCSALDVFLELDLDLTCLPARRRALSELRRRGVEIAFTVYDLLPIKFERNFPPEASKAFGEWLEMFSQVADRAACISRAAADEYLAWLDQRGPKRLRPLAVSWMHLGADFENSRPTFGLPAGAAGVIAQIAARPSFLMVATVGHGKGHAQALAAFEQLWRDGLDVPLVLVGGVGWNMADMEAKLRDHPENGRRLYWLKQISDEYLEKVYAASACLISASGGEGFGLPVIEAARRRLPLLIRDLPVFREIAGAHATYFSGTSPVDLASAVRSWLQVREKGETPLSTGLRVQNWAESADQLKDILAGNAVYRLWPDRPVTVANGGNLSSEFALGDAQPAPL
jgi:glycosyltransferase involved in cell wall biosynthesis